MKIIIDGNSIFYKLYFGMKDVEASNQAGVKTSAIYGFLRYLNSLKSTYNIKTSDFYITFDNVTSKDVRKNLFSEYKENRLKTDSELFTQMGYLLKILDAEGIRYLTIKNVEADDICFQLSLKTHGEHIDSLVISRDRDLLLNLYVSESTKVLIDQGSGKSTLFTRDTFNLEYGFSYIHFLDYKTLLGDSSDNIKGISGVGEVGAKNLFIELDSLGVTLIQILNNQELIDKLSTKSKKIVEKVNEQKESYDLYKKLMAPITGFGIPEVLLEPNYQQADQLYSFLQIEKNRYKRDSDN